MALPPGTRLGPYEILAPLAAGGMGEVYRASDTRLGREVAIKVLPQHLTATSEAHARFEREARTVSKLNHPNICALYDVGREGAVDFIVLELLHGETLSSRLSRGPLPLGELLGLARQIAGALDRAHRAGLLHRDIKPGNVMLTRDGAKLLDFGLAKHDRGAFAGASPTAATETAGAVDEPATGEGRIVGTLGYIAPERLEGREADARSDVFSFGAVLYEMATGRPAFPGKSPASVIAAILGNEPEPLTSLQPTAPAALDRLIRTCLAKDPDSRRQTMRDVAIDLEWIAEGGSGPGIPTAASPRRHGLARLAWTSAAVATGAAAMFVADHLVGRRPAPEPVRFKFEAPAGVREMGSPRISPDGRYLAFNAEDSSGVYRIWIRPMNSPAAQPTSGTEGAGRPFWSPDSRSVGFTAGNKLKKIEVAGGPPVTICEITSDGDGSWGPSGVILFDGADSIRAVSAAGGVPAGAAGLDRSRGETTNGWPQFLPDGRHFLYLGWCGDQPDSVALRVGRLGSKETKVLAIGRFSRVEYVPPGYVLYVRGRTLFARPFDAKRLRLAGDPFPVVEQVGTQGREAPNADYSASVNGTLVWRERSATGGRQLIWRDRAGRELGTLGAIADYAGIALSPDEQHVAISIPEPGTSGHDLWLLDVARDVASRFTFHPLDDGWPVWSADGTKIFFASNRTGTYRVYEKPWNGTGDERELSLPAGYLGPRDASRDGRFLACGSFGTPSTGWDIALVSLGSEPRTSPVLSSTFQEWEPSLSPDGRWLAYTSNESGRREVYVVAYPGLVGKWQISTGGGWDPQWSADGRELFFLTPAGALMSASVSTGPTFRVASPVRLFDVDPPGRYPGARNYASTSDGRRFLVKEFSRKQSPPATTVLLNWIAALGRR